VHAQLESELLHPAVLRVAGSDPAVSDAAACRAATLQAIERVEVLPVRDGLHAAAMAWLRDCARRWCEAEAPVFELARRVGLDVAALDLEMAARQESLLTAGREL
jgi:hypothetical protein